MSCESESSVMLLFLDMLTIHSSVQASPNGKNLALHHETSKSWELQ